jgi:FAD/FMN-containing dehydrogenase/Fe-S oxidoreductase
MDSNERVITDLVQALKPAIRGEVRTDHLTRHLYSTDASDYCKVPLGVMIPADVEDVRAAMEIAARLKIPIIPRGSGSSLSGQTVGAGLVIDHSKYLNKILEINTEERWARVESGVVLDALNLALAPDGLMVGPDPSSSVVATLGGMVGSNSTGSHSVRYGMMADHILEVEVVLADGSKALLSGKDASTVAQLAQQENLEGRLYRQIPPLLDEYRSDIETGYPKTWRNVAGYRLNYLLEARRKRKAFSLAPLMAGSEGSLAVVTQVKLGVVPRPVAVNLMILHFASLQRALEAVPSILDHQPAAVEMMTAPSIMVADNHPGFRSQLRKFVQGNPGAILIVEFAEASQAAMTRRIDTFRSRLTKQACGEPVTHCTTPAQISNVWQLRKAIFGLLLSRPGDDKLTMIIDDATVPVNQLSSYTRNVVAAGKNYGIDINFDAHASAGCLHMGLTINFKTPEGMRHLELLSKEIMEIAICHNGTTTGEHGEGLARSYFNEQLYGRRLHNAFHKIKNAFDPDNRMNPHKVLNPIEPWDTRWLRYHPGYRTPLAPTPTFFDFGDYGGFAGLVEMCNGMGVCRSQTVGTMCPSYRVTRDERHTTRGRANALRAAMAGQLGPEGLAGESVFSTMDLCLACKACRTECGSKVDMAKLKYEFLAYYHSRHGIPLRNRMFGYMDVAGRMGGKAPRFANMLYRNRSFRRLLDGIVGIDQRRELPLLADETFQQWFHRRPVGQHHSRPSVILWDDCHVSFHEPEIGVAAVQVLEAAGFEVRLIDSRRCCGRPLISKGLLKAARDNARHNVRQLVAHAKRGIPIIGIEPSCIACFRDEYPDLLKSDDAVEVARHANFFEEFVTDAHQMTQEKLSLAFNRQGRARTIKLHTHCYQKAFGTAAKVAAMLDMLPNTRVEEIDSGCCGMAGSFGYEKEHYDISMAIGEQSLFPSIRAVSPETIVAAAGTSCRQQIKDGTQRKAVHPIVIMAQALREKENQAYENETAAI